MGLKCCLTAVIAISTGIALGSFGHYAAASDRDPPLASDSGPKPPRSAASSVPDKESASVAPKTLDRILANWKAREERTRSLHFEWESRLFFGAAAEARAKGKAAEEDPRSGRVSYWSEGLDRRRTDTVPFALPAPNAVLYIYPKIHLVTNGPTECRVEDPGNVAGLPVAAIGPRQEPRLAFGPTAVTLTFHALDAFQVNSRSPRFRVINEDAVIEGLHCVELQNANDQGDVFENCWVDPARDDVVVAYEFRMLPRRRRELQRTTAIEYQRDSVHGWVPSRWTYKEPGNCLNENTITKYAINERFPEEIFSLKVSPSTVVFDMRSAEQYRVAADGGKADIVKFDSPASLKVGQVLSARTDFQIQPQSLKDAIDFIAARYQIPIILKMADFEAANVDLSTEVAAERQGVKVADLLKTLSAPMAKPFGFRIEDEVLKISPKFTEHGALRVRPAPEPQKPETPRARKIREALEQPVDFTIQPQSLKDALDWIGARYQIAIESDPLADSLTEVKGAFPGIKLRSLLSILLEQCPGELAFKIDRDGLKIYSKTATR